jgi:hypothetical protein
LNRDGGDKKKNTDIGTLYKVLVSRQPSEGVRMIKRCENQPSIRNKNEVVSSISTTLYQKEVPHEQNFNKENGTGQG